MKSTTSRKGQTSITHLMNFSLPPRPTYNQHQGHSYRNIRRNPTWGLGSGYHAVDKARCAQVSEIQLTITDRHRFVHANYRFIVDPRGDYHAQSTDADVYLDWNNVHQILASPHSQAAACPICLGEPVAPRMAKCGHIFCLPCLIRYMHSTDEAERLPDKRARWKKCPICWDSIYISETRPVRWYVGQEGPTPPHEGEDIVLRLVLRAAGSTLGLPKESQSLAKSEDIPWHFAADVLDFARVMRGTEDYLLEQFDAEIEQLEELERHDELMYGEDSEWTGKAVRAVKEAKEKVRGLGNGPSTTFKPTATPHRRQLSPTDAFQASIRTTDTFTDTQDASLPANTLNSISSPATSALSTSLAQFRHQQQYGVPTPPSDYYFYQALLHYYLAPLDIRILKAAFGDFSNFPSTILPRVEHLSTGHVVDEELRKRTKYLAHLPYGCEVNFLECDWTDTVPAEILEKFKDEIERRRSRHSDKAAREEKERVRAEKEEDDKRYAAARRRRPSSPNIGRFAPDDFQPLQASEAGSFDAAIVSTSPPWGASRPNGAGYASLASPSTSPNAHRTVWGTTVVAPASPIISAPTEAPVDDGWLQGWERELMHDDDSLVAHVEAMSVGESSKSGAVASTTGKKKKGKKITLMSTNVRRGA